MLHPLYPCSVWHHQLLIDPCSDRSNTYSTLTNEFPFGVSFLFGIVESFVPIHNLLLYWFFRSHIRIFIIRRAALQGNRLKRTNGRSHLIVIVQISLG